MTQLARLLPLMLWLTACSTPPPPAAPLPDWIHGPARTIDGGYIIFVATGEDRSPEHAGLKAEGAALQDLANECSLIPLGTRLEDRAMRTENNLRTAYAKVAVEFESRRWPSRHLRRPRPPRRRHRSTATTGTS